MMSERSEERSTEEPLEAEFSTGQALYFLGMFGGVLCFVIGILLGLISVGAFEPFGLFKDLSLVVKIWWAILGIFLLGFGFFLFFRGIKVRGLRVRVFPSFMAIVQGEKTEVVPWSNLVGLSFLGDLTIRTETDMVFINVTGGITKSGLPGDRAFVLYLNNGEYKRFDDWLKNFNDLGKLVQEKMLRINWPELQIMYEKGHMFDFGPLKVTRLQITSKDEGILWNKAEIALSKNKLAIYHSGGSKPWHVLEVGEIVNLHIFLNLARRFHGIDFS
jgi:hypothetical protein